MMDYPAAGEVRDLIGRQDEKKTIFPSTIITSAFTESLTAKSINVVPINTTEFSE